MPTLGFSTFQNPSVLVQHNQQLATPTVAITISNLKKVINRENPHAHIPECHLLGNFGWGVQGLLGALCFSILFIKRLHERERRSRLIFLFDTVKQGCGSFTLHILNMMASYLQSKPNQTMQQDPCTWYLINIMLDTTLGVFITYSLLTLIRSSLLSSSRYLEFGYYGDPPSLKACLMQLTIWQIIVIVMKLIMVIIMHIFSVPLYSTASFLLYPFNFHPRIKLVIVMILIPFVMNAFQYWVTDNILMKKPSARMSPPLVAQRQPLGFDTNIDPGKTHSSGLHHLSISTAKMDHPKLNFELDFECRSTDESTSDGVVILQQHPVGFSRIDSLK